MSRPGEHAMHPMFAELFMKPDEALEAGEQRRVRRPRRSRQLRTFSAASGKPGVARAVRGALTSQQP